jgi:hypothetical protein
MRFRYFIAWCCCLFIVTGFAACKQKEVPSAAPKVAEFVDYVDVDNEHLKVYKAFVGGHRVFFTSPASNVSWSENKSSASNVVVPPTEEAKKEARRTELKLKLDALTKELETLQ